MENKHSLDQIQALYLSALPQVHEALLKRGYQANPTKLGAAFAVIINQQIGADGQACCFFSVGQEYLKPKTLPQVCEMALALVSAPNGGLRALFLVSAQGIVGWSANGQQIERQGLPAFVQVDSFFKQGESFNVGQAIEAAIANLEKAPSPTRRDYCETFSNRNVLAYAGFCT